MLAHSGIIIMTKNTCFSDLFQVASLLLADGSEYKCSIVSEEVIYCICRIVKTVSLKSSTAYIQTADVQWRVCAGS